MRAIGIIGAAFVASLCLTGCSGTSQIQISVQQFDQSVHSVDTSQTTFLQQFRSASCGDQFLQSALSYSEGNGPVPGLLGEDCVPKGLTDTQISLRENALDALGIYADKIQSLATGNNTTLDINAESLLSSVNKIVPNGSVEKAVETAIVELANIAIDHTRYADIKSAASAASASITAIAADLETENPIIGEATSSSWQGSEIAFITALKARLSGTDKFFGTVYAQNTLSSVAISAATGLPQVDPKAEATEINTALKSIVNANNALARSDNATFTTTIQELVTEVKDAQTINSALQK